MGFQISQLSIDDSSDKNISGVQAYDRAAGGTLIIPAGSSFPVSPVAGELFYRTDLLALFVRNSANTAWEQTTSIPVAHAGTHTEGQPDEIDGDRLAIDFGPVNYSPDASNPEASATSQLSAHLNGIDQELGVPPVFGSNLVKAQSLGVTITTTPDVWVQKVRLTLTVAAGQEGDYHLEWSYFWSHDATNNDFEARIQVNDTTTLMTHVQEPKDSGGSGPGGTNQRFPAAGFISLLGLTAGTYNYDLDLRTRNNNVESTMLDARMRVYRES